MYQTVNQGVGTAVGATQDAKKRKKQKHRKKVGSVM
jgi:hypothetical protein